MTGRVATVTAIDDDGVLRLADGGTLRVSTDSRLFELLYRWLAKGPHTLYVETDDAGLVQLVVPGMERRVERVADAPDGERLRVDIHISAARHHLDTRRPGFDELRRRLADAAASGRPITLFIHPMTLEVLAIS